MAKQYKGSLSLDWYNKQKAILLRSENETKSNTDIPAPKINWVNKEEALFYEINEEEGRGIAPYWVDRNDIRVKEARPLIFKKAYKAIPKDKAGFLPGMSVEYSIQEIDNDDDDIDNILIKGDNLLALNTLKKIFENKPEEEKVKCIFIDPPYNTGKAFKNYDDNLEMSSWLTLMRDRFEILKGLLRNDGYIFVILDDNAIFHCKLLMDEIFGKSNFLGDIVWQSRKSVSNDTFVSLSTNHILLYAKNIEVNSKADFKLEADEDKFSNPDNDPRGKWVADPFDAPEIRANLTYKIVNPNTGEEHYPTSGRHWATEESKYLKLLEDNRIVFGKKGTTKPQLKRFWTEAKNKGKTPTTLWFDEILEDDYPNPALWTDLPTTTNGTQDLEKLFGSKVFDNPKPEGLIERVIKLSTSENDVVLDCFGGSGSTFATAHKMGRRWLGVEVGEHSETIIVERLKKIIDNKDKTGISKSVNWQGGGSFKFYHLGDSIIKINEDGTGDFNWNLSKEFIQESFLSSYDYIIDNTIDFKEGELFIDKKNQPIVGVQNVGTKKRIAVITLNEPNGKLTTLSYDEMQSIYKTIKKKYSPEYINIFTNRGVEIAYDSKPDDLEVIKIPNAIFAELEK
jgi:DNA modification methylase